MAKTVRPAAVVMAMVYVLEMAHEKAMASASATMDTQAMTVSPVPMDSMNHSEMSQSCSAHRAIFHAMANALDREIKIVKGAPKDGSPVRELVA